MKALESVGSQSGAPSYDVFIDKCGIVASAAGPPSGSRKKSTLSRSIQSARLSDDDDVLQSLRIRTKSLRVILSKNARRGSVRVRSRLICNRTLFFFFFFFFFFFSLTFPIYRHKKVIWSSVGTSPPSSEKVLPKERRRWRHRDRREGSVANAPRKEDDVVVWDDSIDIVSRFCGDEEEGARLERRATRRVAVAVPDDSEDEEHFEDAGDDDNEEEDPVEAKTAEEKHCWAPLHEDVSKPTSRTESRWRRKYTETKTRRYKSCGATDSGRR